MSKPSPARITHILEKVTGILVGVLGVCILFRQLIIVSPEQILWADNFDSKLIYWIVNWGYHILFEVKQPLNFWNANSFFPESQTLAYSDSILSIQLLFSPLRAIGIQPLTSLYLSLAGFTVAGCFFTDRALRRLGFFSNLEIILIVFATHFSLSFVTFLNHYQLFGCHLAPGFFLYLYLFLKDFKRKDFIITSCLFCIGVTFATYLAPMEVCLAIAAVPSILFLRQEVGIKKILQRFGWINAILGLLFALLLYFVQFQPYLAKFQGSSSPNFQDYIVYSATPISLFKNISINSYWYGAPYYSVNGQWEYSYFPGYLLLIPGVIFLLYIFGSRLLTTYRSIREGKLQLGHFSQEAKFLLFVIIFFFLIWILSLGPYIRKFNLPNPIYWFFIKTIPGMANIRAPGRFGIWFGLPLSVFVVFLIRQLKLRRVIHQIVLGILLIAIVIESFPTHPTYPFSADPTGIYKKTAQLIPEGTPLLELPIVGEGVYGTLENVQQQLDGSTIHWAKLVTGYGAASTPDYDMIVNIDNQIHQSGEIQPMIDFAHRLNIYNFLVYLPAYPKNAQAQWEKLFSNSSSIELLKEDDYILFQIK